MSRDHRDLGYDDFSYPQGLTSRRELFDSPVQKILSSVLKRPWIVILTFFLITIPSAFYLYNKVPVYRSQGIILIASKTDSRAVNFRSAEAFLEDGGFSEEFYMAVLESNSYWYDVAKRVSETLPQYDSDSLRSEVRKGLKYDRKPRTTGYFIISGTSHNPEVAHHIASQGIASLEEQVNSIKRSDAKFLVEYLDKLLLELNDKLAGLEAESRDFLNQKNLRVDDVALGMDSELSSLEQKLSEAEARRDLAKMQLDNYTSQIEQRIYAYNTDISQESSEIKDIRLNLMKLKSLLQDTTHSEADKGEIEQLQAERKQLLQKLISLQSFYDGTGEKPNLRATQVSFSKLESQLENWLIEFSNAKIQCGYYEAKINQFIRDHPNYSTDILNYLNFHRSKQVLQRAIDILVEKRESARIQMASESGGVKIVDSPQIPTSPIPERTVLFLFIAIIASLGLGVFIAYVVDYFDNTVQSERELSERYNLSVYGSVPVLDSRSFRRRHSSTLKAPTETDNGAINLTLLDYHSESSPVAEAYRSLRTSIKFQLHEKGQNILVISSSVASEGKTLTTYNIGLSFAQGGFRVMIIDADLRRAYQHKLFGVERTPGLTDHLLNDYKYEECIRQGKNPNLFLMPAGHKVNNPADLLSSKRMFELLDSIKQKFDIVLIDTPPISPCMDSRNLAAYTGGLVLITRAEMTKYPVLEHCIDLCRRVNVDIFGVVVNHASFRYSYGYYYVYQRTNPYGYYYSGYQYYYSQDPETGERVKEKKRRRRTQKSEST